MQNHPKQKSENNMQVGDHIIFMLLLHLWCPVAAGGWAMHRISAYMYTHIISDYLRLFDIVLYHPMLSLGTDPILLCFEGPMLVSSRDP